MLRRWRALVIAEKPAEGRQGSCVVVQRQPRTFTFGNHFDVDRIVAVAEIGDKTQSATWLLAVQLHNVELVTVGTTIGMMLANIPGGAHVQ